MLQCWSISETSEKRQRMLMLMASSGKESPGLDKDRKAFVAACPRGCGVTHHGFCVLGLQPVLCLGSSAISLVTPRHFLPASPFCQASWVHHCNSTLRNHSLSEITGIGTLAPVLLMARVCTFPYDLHGFAIQLPSPG